MPSLPDIEAFRSALNGLGVLAIRDVAAVWRELSEESPDVITAVLQGAIPAALEPYIVGASDLATVWYSELSDAPYAAVPAAPPPTEQIQASVRWATGPLYGRGAAPVLDLLAGAAQRYVFSGARNTLVDNSSREGVRWARYASANACAFCRMLATRGAAYTSESAAGVVVGRGQEVSLSERRRRAAGHTRRTAGRFMAGGARTRGTQGMGERFHDNCRCLPVPVRAGDSYTPPSYVDEWEQQYIEATRETPGTGKYGAIDTRAVLAHMRRNGAQ